MITATWRIGGWYNIYEPMASCNKFCFPFSIGLFLVLLRWAHCPVAAQCTVSARARCEHSRDSTDAACTSDWIIWFESRQPRWASSCRLSCHCASLHSASRLPHTMGALLAGSLCQECLRLHSNYGWHSRFQWKGRERGERVVYSEKRANLLAADSDSA